jgi:hypothetical protein
MTGQLPQEPVGWASFLSACVVVLAAVASAVLYVKRRIDKALNAWRGGDAAINRRVDDIAANTVREIDALRLAEKTRADAHEQKDDERFARVHARMDEVAVLMARREDLGRVEGKIDQLLLNAANRAG